ncbi:TetR/AcrR family transcriptional regulator C-terminal domain-containing protein [Dorea sp. AF24-7LB]|uniref:TetR/AcrR family transcriptional regulator C-terminal domain-containing protein n=1 Tax=Dorea sp. AF24-7LB TaxID=2293097 RepID=UPI001FAACF2A|nr:TetR/AcrR family transcriptional regulator C-terminal domain-containing protein [Dorea sp. AF24-7LB]
MFFRAAFKTDEQNCLRQHDFKLIFEFYTRQIESRTGQKLNEKLKFLLEMHCQGSVYMTTQWVLGYRKSTPEKMHAVRVTRKIQM